MALKADEIEHFNRWSSSYDRFRGQRYLDRLHQALLGFLPAGISPNSILDVGCGTGRLLRRAQDRWRRMAMDLPVESHRCLLVTLARGRRARERPVHWAARLGAHMNWDAVGAIAELLAAIGVIVSLGYLAQQVRHNTRSVRAASYQSWFTSYDSFSNLLLGDAGFDALLHRAASRPQDPTPDERRRFLGILRRGFRQFESLYYQYREGMIDRDLFEAWVSIYSRSAQGPLFEEFWQADRSIFSAAFRDFVAERFAPTR
jgi:SAM-dependent methyltransferase